MAQREFNDTRPSGLPQVLGVGVLDEALRAAFSPDSRRFAYWADIVEKGVAIVENDVAVGPILRAAGYPVFSPDGRRLAFVGKTHDGKVVLIVDGMRMGEWAADVASLPAFTPDGRHVATSIQINRGGLFRKRSYATVAVNGQAFEALEADDIQAQAAMTADGRRAAWWIRRNAQQLLVEDGVVRTDAAAPRTDIEFSASGRLVYGAAIADGETVVVDGYPGPTAQAVVPMRSAAQTFGHGAQMEGALPWRISPDGNRIAWAGVFDGAQHPVLDDVVGPACDLIVGFQFTEDSSATWWGVRGGELVRISHTAAT